MKPSRNGIGDASAGLSPAPRRQAPGGGLRKGRNATVSAFLCFPPQIKSQVVTGRFRCRTVVPALPILNVIPSPE